MDHYIELAITKGFFSERRTLPFLASQDCASRVAGDTGTVPLGGLTGEWKYLLACAWKVLQRTKLLGPTVA